MKKALLDTRQHVPTYFANNREFQVFLRSLNVALTVVNSDTNHFISNLLNPLQCKARLLPLLSNYVGYEYDPKERIITNRWITKLYPLLVRNRGNEIGITLAVAMSLSLLADIDTVDLERNFSIDLDTAYDKFGRKTERIKIYVYYESYLSILRNLIEVVRPAGIMVEFIPAQNISSSETIVLTDEVSIAKYDYITGKLLSINDIDVYVQNNWEVLMDDSLLDKVWATLEPNTWKDLEDKTWEDLEPYMAHIKSWAMPGLAPYEIENLNPKTTGEHLIDGRFIDKFGNDLNKYVDSETSKILYDTGIWTGEIVRQTRIFEINEITGKETYTGKYFDVSNPAKVLNTYYKLLDDSLFSGFYLSKDDFVIYNTNNQSTTLKLKSYVMNINTIPTEVWKVYDERTDIKYDWHVDILTRQFIKDNDGQHLEFKGLQVPFSNTTYIGQKAYLMKINRVTNEFSASQYYVNKYGDIIDQAGNILLSKQDRYKISDSTMIGFSEIHHNNDAKRLSTYDGTNILQREWSFMKDDHIQDIPGRQDAFPNDDRDIITETDPRFTFKLSNFNIGNPIREYTGSELIRFVSNTNLQEIRTIDGKLIVPLFVTTFDSENANGDLIININLPLNYSLADVFNNMNIRFENKVPNDTILNPYWDIFVDWNPNVRNKALFNLSQLPNPIHFIKVGTIEPRTLHWTGNVLTFKPKLYDGTKTLYNKKNLKNEDLKLHQDIIMKDYS